MSKRTFFTNITPLPPGITRQTVLETLYTHVEMIDLNPLVEERHPIKPPGKATAEEYHCQWYELTDRISYLPGGLVSGKVTYQACFHDLANGLQTHVYAPMGLDIKNKWTIGGTLPGEPTQPVEIGQGIPLQGLYLREDVDMRCNMLMTNFVKKTLKKAHAALVARLVVKAQLYEAASINDCLSDKTYRSDECPEHSSPALSIARLNANRSPHLSLSHRSCSGRSMQSPLSSPSFPPPMQAPSSSGNSNGNGLVPEPLNLQSQSSFSMPGRMSFQSGLNGSMYSTLPYGGPGHQADLSFAQVMQLQQQQQAQQHAMMLQGRNPYQASELGGQYEQPEVSPLPWESKGMGDVTGPPAYEGPPPPPKEPVYLFELPAEIPSKQTTVEQLTDGKDPKAFPGMS
jgi:hypothetical protein